jgi:hypothetical protein
MAKISVVDYSDTMTTEHADPDDAWSADSTFTSHDIQGISLEDTYGDLTVSYDIEYDVPYFLVYYIYSTGDSFHNDEGLIEFIDLYKTRYEAEKAANIIREAAINEWTATILNSDGEAYDEYLSAVHDYFGSLNEVEVVKVERM